MTDIVPADQIEGIVGARRHATHHLGRAVSAEQRVYILHSRACKESGLDLRACSYSAALDLGIDVEAWEQDVTVSLVIQGGVLVPLDFLPPDVALLDADGRVAEVVPVADSIRVTATDVQRDYSVTQEIWDDYILVTAGGCQETHVTVHHKADGTQTHVITVKGVRR